MAASSQPPKQRVKHRTMQMQIACVTTVPVSSGQHKNCSGNTVWTRLQPKFIE